jgi:hypothetical protein
MTKFRRKSVLSSCPRHLTITVLPFCHRLAHTRIVRRSYPLHLLTLRVIRLYSCSRGQCHRPDQPEELPDRRLTEAELCIAKGCFFLSLCIAILGFLTAWSSRFHWRSSLVPGHLWSSQPCHVTRVEGRNARGFSLFFLGASFFLLNPSFYFYHSSFPLYFLYTTFMLLSSLAILGLPLGCHTVR